MEARENGSVVRVLSQERVRQEFRSLESKKMLVGMVAWEDTDRHLQSREGWLGSSKPGTSC